MAAASQPPAPTREVPSLPRRQRTAHKGQAGCVAIVAGSRGMGGAACLAGVGALRGGAGLVRVCCAESVLLTVANCDPCLMTVPLAEDAAGRISAAATPQLRAALQWADVLALGPGLGQSADLRQVIQTVLREFEKPLVLDADGLNNIAPVPRWWRARGDRPTVITPHPGEIERLRRGAGLETDRQQSDEVRLGTAYELACLTGLTVVLKGYRTVVCTPGATYVNESGNPGMATAGMGDVLTGLIAALMGQGLEAFAAARLGVYAHGLAADHCAKRIAPVGYLSREVADALPVALARALQPPVGFNR